MEVFISILPATILLEFQKMNQEIESYRDLEPADENELNLWLDYFEDSLKNSLTQIRRYKINTTNWDLQMFFVAANCVYDATQGLMKLEFFCKNEIAVWDKISKYRKYFEITKLKDLRDESIHKDWLYSQKSKQTRPLQAGNIIHLGSLLITSDEIVYQNGIHKANILDAFRAISELSKDLKLVFKRKIKKNPDRSKYCIGMISWFYMKNFLKNRKRTLSVRDLLKFAQ